MFGAPAKLGKSKKKSYDLPVTRYNSSTWPFKHGIVAANGEAGVIRAVPGLINKTAAVVGSIEKEDKVSHTSKVDYSRRQR